ncbi:MAG TPA: LemA family protein [bacterium]|nr:LemA family protein [bacterium]
MRVATVVVLGLALVGVIVYSTVAGTYNRLVQANQQVSAAQAEVETQLQRRFDLVPNLVEATRATLTQERAVFGAIAQARTHYAGTQAGTPERVEAANQYESAIARLLVIVENYPVLRSNETVQALMRQLASTENEVAFARRGYNASVQAYDTMVQSFPTTLIAGSLGFHPRPYFQAQPGAEQAPRVNLTPQP